MPTFTVETGTIASGWPDASTDMFVYFSMRYRHLLYDEIMGYRDAGQPVPNELHDWYVQLRGSPASSPT